MLDLVGISSHDNKHKVEIRYHVVYLARISAAVRWANRSKEYVKANHHH